MTDVRQRRRRVPWRLAASLALVAALAGCAPVRHYEAARVLADLAAGDAPSALKAATPTPLRRTVSYEVGGREREADLYLPGPLDGCKEPAERRAAGCPRAGIVAVPGAVPQGRRDPRLVAFATTLARAGFAVLAPEPAGFREMRIRPDDVDELAAAFAHLADRPELAPGGRAGLFAFSYSVGPTVLAALEPGIRERVRFIVGVGGYHDLPRAMRFFTTGWFEHDGQWSHVKPDDTGRLVLVYSSLDYLSSPADRSIFERMVALRAENPDAELSTLAERLSADGRALYDLAVNDDPARFPALLERLPEAMRADLARLDLARHDLKALEARLLLVHGRNDNLIPWPESLALAAAVPEGQARVFVIDHVLGHVDLDVGSLLTWRFWREDLPDLWRLWRVVDALLAEREAGT